MLSNNNPSSIQGRRQRRRLEHRRQNSLDAPLLVTQLPGNALAPRPLHRRGQSLDQHSTLSPSFSRLSTHDHRPLDTNHSGHLPQHSLQGAQQHSTAQPGLQQPPPRHVVHMDPRMHPRLVQQMMQEQEAARQVIAPPEQAMRAINDQIKSFFEQYPGYANPSPQSSPNLDMQQETGPMGHATAATATTPVMLQRAATPPPHASFLPTPPPTQKTAGRVVRHMDSAPMPVNLANVPMLHIQHPHSHDMPLFEHNFAAAAADHASSSYQSSPVEAMSPHMSPSKQASSSMRSGGGGGGGAMMSGMPTLFEDGPAPMPSPDMYAHQMMLAAAAAQEARFFYYPDSPMRIPLSPREALLANLDVDASIEDTGISAEEVSAYISAQDAGDGKWTCLFPGCDKKFGRKENIRSHVQTHLGDRQFRCNHCGKCFVRQHDLKRHAKIHSGDKPHKCPCGNGFARQDALTRHRQRGVCSGALPGFERREVKRGRPRKHRPELADRAQKATKARQMDRQGSEDPAGAATTTAAAGAACYSSSSSPSESGTGSNPYTPLLHADPYDDDEEGEDNYDLTTGEGVDAFLRAYQDNTPPTSPPTAAGAAAVTAQSSPSHLTLASPTALSPSSHLHPPVLDLSSVPDLRASSSDGGAAAASSSQPEPSPSSFADGVFDWAAVDSQPSLVQDGFSPAGGSSSPEAAEADLLWADQEDLFDLGKGGLDAGRVDVVGLDGQASSFDQAGSMMMMMDMSWTL